MIVNKNSTAATKKGWVRIFVEKNILKYLKITCGRSIISLTERLAPKTGWAVKKYKGLLKLTFRKNMYTRIPIGATAKSLLQ